MTRPPTPLVSSFVVCREIVEDRPRDRCILIDPLCEVKCPHFPFHTALSFSLLMTEVQGEYVLELLLRTPEGQTACTTRLNAPLRSDDPLQPYRLNLPDVVWLFAWPGRHEVAVLANGEQIAQQPLWVSLAVPPRSPAGRPAV